MKSATMGTVEEIQQLRHQNVKSCGKDGPYKRTTMNSETQQNSQDELFPCHHPHNPSMQNVAERVASFREWPNHIRATAQDLAEAGLYYINIADRTKCFYCDGGLENWEYDDVAWVEHAKFYPDCEYLLRKKGVEFVADVKARHQNLPSPAIYPAPPSGGASVITMQNATITMNGGDISVTPSLSPNTGANFYQTVIPGGNYVQQSIMPGQGSITRVQEVMTPARSLEERINEAMGDELTTLMINFGYGEEVLKRVIRKKLTHSTSGSMFDSASEFLDALEEERRSENSEQVETQENTRRVSESRIPEHSEANETVTSSAQDRIQELIREKRCKICLDQDSSCLFEPCGHMCACLSCGTRLRECPICRRRISTILRVFTS